jgi:Ca2+-binding RTX toxin-like protein
LPRLVLTDTTLADPVLAPIVVDEPLLATRTVRVTDPIVGGSVTLDPGIAPSAPGDILGGNGTDYLYGTAADDRIYGQGGNDYLYGLAGNDILDGGTGADVMAGGAGNDIYHVNDIGDVVWEWGDPSHSDGVDTVYASIGYTLPAGVENLTLKGSADLIGTGNEDDNFILGNWANNTLAGGAGNDSLFGGPGAGTDTLMGGAGNDSLRAGQGADIMFGGVGNDIYEVDVSGDVIFEFAGEGIDTVEAWFSYTLPAEFERLILFAGAADGTGNGLDNEIIGNDAGNVLRGLGGNDTLFGFKGADVLVGGAGRDTLTGGTGADRFVFASPDESSRAAPDRIVGFFEGDGDRIDLSEIDANVNAAGDQTFLWIGNNSSFVPALGAGQLRFYGGFVEGDVDGDLAADFRIEVDSAPLHDFAFIL